MLTPDQSARKDLMLKRHDQAGEPKVPPPERKSDRAEDRKPHVDAQAVIKGNLVKGQHDYSTGKAATPRGTEFYAWNAWNYIGSRPRGDVRDVYRSCRSEWFDFFDNGRKPNFYQLYPTRALGGPVPGKLSPAPAKGVFTQKDETPEVLDSAINSIADIQDAIRALKRKKRTTLQEAELAYLRHLANAAHRPDRVGCSLPYKWQAHHILPMNCFYKYLEEWHIQTILRSDYDINSGQNIIFLPAEKPGMKFHGLPYHGSSHSKYDIQLKDDFDQLKRTLQSLKKKNASHEDLEKAAAADLHTMEDDDFAYLLTLGQVRLT